MLYKQIPAKSAGARLEKFLVQFKDPLVLLLIVITLSGIALSLNNLWTLIFLNPAILCWVAILGEQVWWNDFHLTQGIAKFRKEHQLWLH